MEIYNLEQDVKVFGFRVKSFPEGIGEAFESLLKMIPGGFERPYYGISYMGEDGQMIYIAAALEKYEGEAEKYNCERFTIEQGKYLAVAVHDWREKTACIKDVFYEIIGDKRADNTKPAVEWYKDNHEMICMVQTTHQENGIPG